MIRGAAIVCALCAAAFAQRPEFVRIPPGGFAMAKTETTVAQFAAFVKATGYRTTAEQAGNPRTWRAPGYKVAGNQPVVYVTVKDATAYCEWIGARLPTDAEWERAARAGSTTRHYWGDKIDGRYLWYRANTSGRPGPVGKKLPNAWGLYDVEGNVWEWATSPPEQGGGDGQPARRIVDRLRGYRRRARPAAGAPDRPVDVLQDPGRARPPLRRHRFPLCPRRAVGINDRRSIAQELRGQIHLRNIYPKRS